MADEIITISLNKEDILKLLPADWKIPKRATIKIRIRTNDFAFLSSDRVDISYVKGEI